MWKAMTTKPKRGQAERKLERRMRESDAEARRHGHRCEIDFNEAELAALDAANEKVGRQLAHRQRLKA